MTQMTHLAHMTHRSHLTHMTHRSHVADPHLSSHHFQTLSSIGAGKFGQVLLARECHSDYLVAIKRMSRAELEENGYCEQVKRQIVIQSSLNHPNVLKLFGYFWDQEAVSLILEYAPKGQLYSLMKRHGPLPEPLVGAILEQLLQGLAYLHANNVIHRDIKPENILVSLNTLKIADFGWAVVSSGRRNTFCGTLDYLSPEMLKGDLHDSKVDIWATGVLAFELVVGKTPFEEETYSSTLSSIVDSETQFPTWTSNQFRRFVKKCLQKTPKHRPSAASLLLDPFIKKHSEGELQFPE